MSKRVVPKGAAGGVKPAGNVFADMDNTVLPPIANPKAGAPAGTPMNPEDPTTRLYRGGEPKAAPPVDMSERYGKAVVYGVLAIAALVVAFL